MQTITVAVAKGGTAKTTTAAAIAQAAVHSGKRVLAIDTDTQASLSIILGADPNGAGTYQLLHGTRAEKAIQHTAQGIDVIAGNPDLATEKTKTGSANRLKQALEPIKENYDLCIIDVPPTIGEMTYNALQASDGLIIPVEADQSSVQGLYQIRDITTQIQTSNSSLAILGAVVTRYDSRPKINKILLQAIEETCNELRIPLLGIIRAGVAIREAQALKESLYSYAAGSKQADDYKAIYSRVTDILQKKEK